MKCAIIYLSMTGNTEMIARGICNGIKSVAGNCNLIKFRDANPYGFKDYDLIGFGCPVMSYGVAMPLMEFIKSMRYVGGKHVFAFATHGTHGEFFPYRAGQLLDGRQMKVLGIRRWPGNSYITGHPNPYPTAGHPDNIDVREARQWGAYLAQLSQRIYAGEEGLIPPLPVEPEPGFEATMQELMRKERERSGGTFGTTPPPLQSPSERYVHETCNYPKCSICMDNCPVHGIDLTVEPPVMGEPCAHCMLCAKLCPTGSIAPESFYNTPGEKTVKYVPEFYNERLIVDEEEGIFRRKVPVEEIGWDTPYYKTHDKRPWFIPGKGPNGPKSKYWGEGMAEIEGEIDYGD